MAEMVTPVFGEGADPELGDDELPQGEVVLDQTVDDESEAPTEEQAVDAEGRRSEAAEDRRSRRAGTKTPGVDLTQSAEFRAYQAEMDRKLAAAEQARRELEQRQLADMARQQETQLATLGQRLQQAEPEEAARLIEEMAQLRSQTYLQQERAWAAHVAQRAKEEGVDPSAFDPLTYRGPTGAVQFEADLAKRAAEQARKELADLRKQLGETPKQVKAEVARAMHENGFDRVDVGGPSSGPSADEAMARDVRALNSGKMSRQDFLRKYKSR